MSDEERTWWPDTHDLPAFRVRRGTYSEMEGGDYVRGSEVQLPPDGVTTITLPHTAVRYPTSSLVLADLTPAMKGRLFVTASDYNESDLYHAMSIQWNWPTAVEDTFEEMSIVRSTYGAPTFPEEGQTIFRAVRDYFPVDEDGALMLPAVIYDYLPATRIWRNGVLMDGMAPNGRWYYYTAFFRTNQMDWTPIMSDSGVLPGNYRHREHLWDTIPPYYQWTDENQGRQFLSHFLGILGYELDRTRQFVESVLDLHRIDVVPMQLLRGLGANYGYRYEAGIGDIRYRGMLANISRLLTMRGTAKGLLGIVETVSKYDCDFTPGINSVLLPDTSNFVDSVGQWKPIHPDLTLEIRSGTPEAPIFTPITGYLNWDKVKLVHGRSIPPPPPAGAIGSMFIDSAVADTDDIFITAGAGKDATSEALPFHSGIPVRPEEMWGISLWVKMAAPSEVILYLLPFNRFGKYVDDLDPLPSEVEIPPDTDWYNIAHQGRMPEEAVYLVPAIYFNARDMTGSVGGRSPEIAVGAVSVYRIISDVPTAMTAPDRYLTLGVAYMSLGEPTADDGTGEAYSGYVIGGPVTGEALNVTPTSGEPPS